MKTVIQTSLALVVFLFAGLHAHAGGGCGPSNSCPGPTLSLNTTYSYANSSCTADQDCMDCFAGTGTGCTDICAGAPNHNEDCNSTIMGALCSIEGAFCGSPENTSWAQFCPTTSGTYSFAVSSVSCSGGGASLQYGIYQAGINCTNNTQSDMLSCSGGTTSNTTYSHALTAGQCYLIVFDGNAGAACTWNFLITGPPLPATIQNFVVDRSGKDMVMSWVTSAESNGQEYLVYRRFDDLVYEEELTDDQRYNKYPQKLVAKVPCKNKATGSSYSYVDPYVVSPGLYVYELYLKDMDGTHNFLGQTEAYVDVPTQSRVVNTYFHRETESFDIEVETKVTSIVNLEVYDISGRKVAGLAGVRLPAGTHKVPVDLRGKSTGVYLYKIKVNGDSFSGKLPKP